MSATLRTPLAVGDTVAHRAGQVVIALQRTEHTYTVTIQRGTTGARVDQLSSAHGTEDGARAAARNAYRAFAGGATVEQVIDQLNAAITDQLAEAMRRRDHREVERLNRVMDQLDSDGDRALLDDIAATIAAGPAGRELSGFGRLRAAHAAGLAADRAQRAGRRDLVGAVA